MWIWQWAQGQRVIPYTIGVQQSDMAAPVLFLFPKQAPAEILEKKWINEWSVKRQNIGFYQMLKELAYSLEVAYYQYPYRVRKWYRYRYLAVKGSIPVANVIAMSRWLFYPLTNVRRTDLTPRRATNATRMRSRKNATLFYHQPTSETELLLKTCLCYQTFLHPADISQTNKVESA